MNVHKQQNRMNREMLSKDQKKEGPSMLKGTRITSESREESGVHER